MAREFQPATNDKNGGRKRSTEFARFTTVRARFMSLSGKILRQQILRVPLLTTKLSRLSLYV